MNEELTVIRDSNNEELIKAEQKIIEINFSVEEKLSQIAYLQRESKLL
jgi:hypothetical protein